MPNPDKTFWRHMHQKTPYEFNTGNAQLFPLSFVPVIFYRKSDGFIVYAYAAEWIPYCKKTFNGAQSVIDYLGKYTHRIAISNHRIIRMDDETVTFFVKDYRNKGEWKELTISGIEFIRRFLMHVPPKRFVRIRHYGLLCSRSKRKKLTLCRNLLGCKKYLSKLGDKEMPEILKQLYGINVCVCKSCGGHLGKPQLRIPQRC